MGMECLEKHFEEIFIGPENFLGIESDMWVGPGQLGTLSLGNLKSKI